MLRRGSWLIRGSVLIVRAIPFADLDALALVESFGKAVYVAPG
jgi:hypothetical protein